MKNKNQQNKLILKSPVEALQSHNIILSSEQLKSFNQLISDRGNLEKCLADAINCRNSQSSQIGAAKKEGRPINEIVDKVKYHSVAINDFKDQIKNINVKLLNHFNFDSSSADDVTINHNEANATIKLPTNTPINVSDTFDLSDVTISLLNQSNTNDSILISLHEFMQNQPDSSIYHNYSWQQLIAQSFHHEGFYFIAKTSSNSVIGILPLIRLKSRLFGDFLISMPYFNYGGALAVNSVVEDMLIEKGSKLAAELNVDYVEYRDTHKRNDMQAKSDKVNMILTLQETKQAEWQKFPAKLKSQIRKSKKQGFTIEQGGIELLNNFYAVFSENMRDLGTPVYAKSFFKNILQTFKNESFIIVVKDGSKTVSAGFLLKHKQQLEIPWASTLSQYNSKNANMFLYWNIIKFAIHNNCSTFDFGRSSIGAGTYRFKKQWGAKPLQSYWHYWLNDSIEMPKLNPSNPKFKLVIAIWKRLPLFVTNYLGPMIVKNLP